MGETSTAPTLSGDELVSELHAAWARVSDGYARAWSAMAELSRCSLSGWESTEIAAALTFTARRADYELACALTLVERLPEVHAALATGELDHHKARVFTDYLGEVTDAQAERICARLVTPAAGWTTGQLAARLLREVQAIDPGYTRRTYQQAIRTRGVHGYLDHTGTAVLTGSGLPAADAAAAAARLEQLAATLRAAGYPATVGQTRADLYLRLLDGTLDGQPRAQIIATMLHLGPIPPADTDDTDPAAEPETDDTEAGEPGETDQHGEHGEQSEQAAEQAEEAGPDAAGPAREAGVRCGIEVRVKLTTLLGLDEHPAELPGWGPIPAGAARDLVAAQHRTEWRVAIVDADGYLLHGDLTRRRPAHPEPVDPTGDRTGGIVEIAVPAALLDQLSTLAATYPGWVRLLHGIANIWTHREHARAALDAHPNRRFAHAALRRHVQMRDRNCVGVGCRRSAAAADLDHTRDHACGGMTVTTNNGPTCPRDHAKKHQAGWILEQPEAGHFVWTSPLGRTYHTRGEPIIPDLPEPLPREPDLYPPSIPLTYEGPIIQRLGPSSPPPARPPPTEELPDDPPF